MSADNLTPDQLAAIKERDSTSAPTWYEGPASPKSQCFRDRRALIAHIAELEQQIAALRKDQAYGCNAILELSELKRAAQQTNDVAPIAKITIHELGEIEVQMYAPGLPPGEHYMFPVPVHPNGEWKPLFDVPRIQSEIYEITIAYEKGRCGGVNPYHESQCDEHYAFALGRDNQPRDAQPPLAVHKCAQVGCNNFADTWPGLCEQHQPLSG